MPIDQQYTLADPIVENKAAVLGSELVANGDFSDGSNNWGTTGAGWTFANGLASRDGNATGSGIDQLGIFEAGKTYELNFTVSGRTQGVLAAFVGQGGQNIGNVFSDGDYSFVVTSTLTNKLLLNGASSFDGSIDNVSIREIPASTPYGTLTQFDPAEVQRYTYEANENRWIGEELVVNGDFATDSDWQKGTGWSISNGLLNCDNSQTGNSDCLQNNVTELDFQYLTEFTVSDYLSGNARILLGNIGGAGLNRNSQGTFTEVLTPDSVTNLKVRADANFEGSVDNVSVKRILELP